MTCQEATDDEPAGNDQARQCVGTPTLVNFPNEPSVTGKGGPTLVPAILLGSASRICALGLEGEARIIQDLVAAWGSEVLQAQVPSA